MEMKFDKSCFISIFFWAVIAQTVWCANIYWDNDSANNLWSTAGNWSTDNLPGSSDAAVVDMNSPDHCILNNETTTLWTFVGGTDTGELYLQSDANLTATFVRLGFDCNTFAAGPGGILDINNGGKIHATGTAYAGIGVTSDLTGGFTVDISGANSKLSSDGQIKFGYHAGANTALNMSGGKLETATQLDFAHGITTLNMSGGEIDARYIYFGIGGSSDFEGTVSGGTIDVNGGGGNNWVVIAYQNNDTAELTLTGGALSVNEDLYLGLYDSSEGILNVNGGTVNARSVYNGDGYYGGDPCGIINLQSGQINLNGTYYAGYGSGAYSVLNVSGGQLNTNAFEMGTIGCKKAQVNVTSSGDVNIVGDLIMSNNTAADTNSILNVSGGTIDANSICVGQKSVAEMTVSGGTVTTDESIRVGVEPDAYGSLIISGGTVNCKNLYLSGVGGTLTDQGYAVLNRLRQYFASGYCVGDRMSYPETKIIKDVATEVIPILPAPIKSLPEFLLIMVLGSGGSSMASNPDPCDGASLLGQQAELLTLEWTPGQGAVSQDIYLGTSFNDVNTATTDSNEFLGIVDGSTSKYEPDTLQMGQTYYWRIDCRDGNNIHKGPVWDFSIQSKPTIFFFDLRNIRGLNRNQGYDICHTAYSIQGLANREYPQMFTALHVSSNDTQWLTRLRETGGLCENWYTSGSQWGESTFSHYKNRIGQLIEQFNHLIDGVVLYDPCSATGVISTSLVATTVAGAENGLAVRKDTTAGSLYQYLVNDANGPQLTVLVDLTGKFTGSGTIWQTSISSTGSAKCDAYIWAVEKYIKTGKCDPVELTYSMDLYGLGATSDCLSWGLSKLDYTIMQKGFAFELSPWADETPSDDSGQPTGTDLATYKKILDSCNQQTGKQAMIRYRGFPNWDYKYTNYGGIGGSHSPVDTEWETAKLVTSYNCYIEAEWKGVSNNSIFAALWPNVKARRFVQNRPPTYSEMVSRGLIDGNGDIPAGNYVLIGNGDYDCTNWTLYDMASNWDDPNRGQIYLTWCVNPDILKTAGVAFDYYYRHKSSKDYFIAWDSGAGYVNPSNLHGIRTPSLYPSIVEVWQKHCRQYYRIADYSISGWLLNGNSGTVTSTDLGNYAPFSGDGIGLDSSNTSVSSPTLYSNIATIKRQSHDFLESETMDPNEIIDYPSDVHFAWYRAILKTPSEVKALQDALSSSGHNHQFLDAYTFYYLLRYHLGGDNNYRATWYSDNIPATMQAGQTYSVNVIVRNDGWDTWSEASLYRLAYAVVRGDREPQVKDYERNSRIQIPNDLSVSPGSNITFSFNLTAPSVAGNYKLYYDMVRETNPKVWFSDKGNIEWCMDITVIGSSKGSSLSMTGGQLNAGNTIKFAGGKTTLDITGGVIDTNAIDFGIGGSSNFTGTISDGNIYASGAGVNSIISIANSGDDCATLAVTGGLLQADNAIVVGYYDYSIGTLTIDGGTVSTSSLYNAYGGSGGLPTGAVNLLSGTLQLGYAYFGGTYSGAISTLNVIGGQMSVPWMDIGYSNSGQSSVVNLTGGTISTTETYVAVYAGTNAILNVDGGSISTTGNMQISTFGGVGTCHLTSGSIDVNSILYMTNNTVSASQSYLNVNGGTLECNGLQVGQHGPASFNVRGGTVNCDGGLNIGVYNQGYGDCEFSGGTVDCQSLSFASGSGQGGVIDLTGGLLRLAGNQVSTVNSMVQSGYITAYGGSGTVTVQYDSNLNKTLVYGNP